MALVDSSYYGEYYLFPRVFSGDGNGNRRV